MATFGTFTAGQVLTAAELNGAGAWQDYTPAWTQSTAITKTVNWARYTQLNKLVIGSVKMTATGAGTANNKILVGLPVAASSNNLVMGTMAYFRNGSGYLYSPNHVLYESSTTVGFSYIVGNLNTGVNVTTDARLGQNATPIFGSAITGITVASSDVIFIQFAYEAA